MGNYKEKQIALKTETSQNRVDSLNEDINELEWSLKEKETRKEYYTKGY